MNLSVKLRPLHSRMSQRICFIYFTLNAKRSIKNARFVLICLTVETLLHGRATLKTSWDKNRGANWGKVVKTPDLKKNCKRSKLGRQINNKTTNCLCCGALSRFLALSALLFFFRVSSGLRAAGRVDSSPVRLSARRRAVGKSKSSHYVVSQIPRTRSVSLPSLSYRHRGSELKPPPVHQLAPNFSLCALRLARPLLSCHPSCPVLTHPGVL